MQKFELAQIVTKDNLVHQGVFYEPVKKGDTAILWVHGLAGRFYGDVELLQLFAKQCEQQGVGFAAFNNRGHDMATGMHRINPKKESGYEHVTGGAGYENFEESVHDIDAGITFLHNKGFSRVVIVGKSTGANKVCFYAANKKDPRVAGVILVAPISDRYSPPLPPDEFGKANTLMQKQHESKSKDLISGVHYFPLTADRWASLYTQGSSEDVFNYNDESQPLAVVHNISQPLLVLFAQHDEHADKPIEAIRKVFDTHTSSTRYRSVIFPDADHNFRTKSTELVSTIVDWSASL